MTRVRLPVAGAVVKGTLLLLALSLAGVPAGPAVAAAAAAPTWPAPTGHVNDFAHLIDPASSDSIEALGAELEQKTRAQLAVVTLPDLGGREIEEVATDLFARWGIGRKGENDGVLILLALQERRVRIEPGYGLEGALPDGRLGGIIRRVMGPDLAANRFGPGLLEGAKAVAAAIAQEKGVALTGAAGVVPPPKDGGDIGFPGIVLLFVILVAFMVLGSIFNRATRGRGGWSDWSGRRGGWYGPWGGGFGGMGGLGGMGGSRGGFGGFGGFGGGMSGGGGASGRF
ncbi:MAG TPA: TPM domain-containing protein [Candidatus Limnocylindrales bacterium]|nr:TPM domain-containing protein [Candidatus Limnocylindrales bacterium]